MSVSPGDPITPGPFININDDIDDCMDHLGLSWSDSADWNPSSGDPVVHDHPTEIKGKADYTWSNWCTIHDGSDFSNYRSNEKGHYETSYDSGYDSSHVMSFDSGDDFSYDSGYDSAYDGTDNGTYDGTNYNSVNSNN